MDIKQWIGIWCDDSIIQRLFIENNSCRIINTWFILAQYQHKYLIVKILEVHLVLNKFQKILFKMWMIANSLWEQKMLFWKYEMNIKTFMSMRVCVFAYTPMHTKHNTVLIWRSEDSLWKFILSFYCACPRNWIQVARLAGKHLCLWATFPALQ